MRGRFPRFTVLGFLLGSVFSLLIATLAAQSPLSAQIQRALAGFQSLTNNWTATQTVTKAAIAATSTDSLVLANTTVATAGVPVQQSPRLRFSGNVWNTTAVAANNTSDFWIENVPISALNPQGQLYFRHSLNGAASTLPLIVTQQGGVTALAYLEANSTSYIDFTSRAMARSPVNGQWTFSNAAETIGVNLKFDALPTVASGFGTSPAVTAGSTPLAGSVNVGTGGTATSGVINFNGTAFPSAPFCLADSGTSNITTRVSATTTQLTLTVTVAWSASDVITWLCISPRA